MSDILNNTTIGVEIETCVHYPESTVEQHWMMIRDHFFLTLQEKCPEMNFSTETEPDDYTRWKLVNDRSIKCSREEIEEEEKRKKLVAFPKDFNDDLEYAPVEIVSRVYDYPNLNSLIDTIENCLVPGMLGDDVVYGFNSTQGIHYNIGNKKLYNDENRNSIIENILIVWWLFEHTLVLLLPEHRQRMVNHGDYCKSVKRVFRNIENMRGSWLEKYTKDEGKYTSINIKGIDPETFDTSNVYFEFRLGSVHLKPELFEAWIQILSTILVIGIDDDLYSEVTENITRLDQANEKLLIRIMNRIGINGSQVISVLKQQDDDPFY